jgi:hypothetical protein
MDWIVLGVLLAAVVVWALVRYYRRTAGSDGSHHGGTRKPIDWLGQ